MAVFVLDTRNQKDDFVEKALKKLGHTIIRSKLPFGDVACTSNMLNVVDLKSSGGGLIELSHNICSHDHTRLTTEIRNCLKVGGRITFLVFEPNIYSVEDVPSWVVPTFHNNQYGKEYYLNGVKVPKNERIEGVRYETRSVLLHRKGEPKTRVKPIVLYKAMKTMSEPNHYGPNTKVDFVFTNKDNCGRVIENLILI